MDRLFPQTINSRKDTQFLLHKPGCLFRMQLHGTKCQLLRCERRKAPTFEEIGEIKLERVSGEDSYERASEAIVPTGDPAHFTSQLEFGGDKHNWEGRSDERIKLAVMTALHWDLAVPRDRVQVSVHRGWVTLTGRVTREYEKERAEADALMCSRCRRGNGG